LVCAILVLNRSFVTWWVGASQYGGFKLSVLIMLLILLRHWSRTLINTIFCFGYEKWISVVSLADGAVTVVSAVVLVHFLGAVGAPLGGIIGVCAVSIPANLWALAKELETSPGRLFAPIRSWVLRLAMLVLLAALVQRSFLWHSFPVMVAVGVGSLLVYAAVMLQIMLAPPCSVYLKPFFSQMRGRLRRMLKIEKTAVPITTAGTE
jgi:hypothetical protein